MLDRCPVPRSREFTSLPGWVSRLPWATEPGEQLSRTGEDPTPKDSSLLPAPGGTRFIVLTFPPDTAMADPAFDPVAFDREQRIDSPGIADLIEPDGMHATPTVDYGIVLQGEIVLEGGTHTASRRRPYEFRQRCACCRQGGVNGDRIRPRRSFPLVVRFVSESLLGVRDGRPGLRRHHNRGVRAGGSRRQGGDEAVTAEAVSNFEMGVGLVVAVALLGYLVLALIFPERF